MVYALLTTPIPLASAVCFAIALNLLVYGPLTRREYWIVVAVTTVVVLCLSTAFAQTVIMPSVPGLPNVPALGQRGFVVTPDTIRPTTPGLPYPSLTEPGFVVSPDSPRPHLIPVFPCSPPTDADDDQ